MNKTVIADLPTYEIKPASDTPKSCVIFLHGYGANGQDLIGIGDQWKATLPDTVFISPDAPQPCEMSAMGRQWFSLAEYTIPGMEREIVKAWPVLDQYIQAVVQTYDIPLDKIILCGFSQGTMMALYALPRMTKPLGGIVGYSGRLLDDDGFAKGTNKETPVYLVHGEADPVVPVESWDHAHSVLERNGYSVNGFTVPNLPHGIDAKGMAAGLEFIQKNLMV